MQSNFTAGTWQWSMWYAKCTKLKTLARQWLMSLLTADFDTNFSWPCRLKKIFRRAKKVVDSPCWDWRCKLFYIFCLLCGSESYHYKNYRQNPKNILQFFLRFYTLTTIVLSSNKSKMSAPKWTKNLNSFTKPCTVDYFICLQY